MPTRLVIEGGVPLRGAVAVSAAKNAALPALTAALLTVEPVALDNVPLLADVATIRSLLEQKSAFASWKTVWLTGKALARNCRQQ